MQDPKTRDDLADVDRELLEKRSREFVRLRDGGDVDGVLKLMASTVVFEPCLPRQPLVAKRECEGKPAVRAMLRQRHQDYESVASKVQLVVADKGYVVIRRKTQMRHRGTSACGTFVAMDLLRFRDGLIVEFAEYTDTAAVERLGADRQPV